MAIDWDDLKIFRTAVECGDYSNAARALAMDRTTVARRIVRLERTMGAALWELAEDGYRPTAAGRMVLDAAENMARAAEAVTRDAPAHDARPVRLAGSGGLAAALFPAMAEAIAASRDCRIELTGARDALSAVARREADLGIAIARALPKDIAGTRAGAFVQRRYRARKGVHDRAITWNRAALLANPQGWARLNAPAATVPTAIEVDSFTTMIAAVRAGLGTAWLWDRLVDDDAGFERLSDSAPDTAAADIWVVHSAGFVPDAALGALSARLTEAIGQLSGALAQPSIR